MVYLWPRHLSCVCVVVALVFSLHFLCCCVGGTVPPILLYCQRFCCVGAYRCTKATIDPTLLFCRRNCCVGAFVARFLSLHRHYCSAFAVVAQARSICYIWHFSEAVFVLALSFRPVYCCAGHSDALASFCIFSIVVLASSLFRHYLCGIAAPRPALFSLTLLQGTLHLSHITHILCSLLFAPTFGESCTLLMHRSDTAAHHLHCCFHKSINLAHMWAQLRKTCAKAPVQASFSFFRQN